MQKMPDYMADDGANGVKVTLLDGRVLTMREPRVEDQLAAKGGNDEREIALVANLCEIAPAEIRALTIRNYKRLQQALVFLST